MHAIIPVAGIGTRLRPHTYTLPKVLLQVAGKPILGHILDRLVESGVKSATIVVGYLGDLVQEYVREEYPNLKTNFVEQPELLGLGHSIWVAREFIPKDGSPLFIILGDTIFGVDLKPVFATPTSALGVKEVPDPRRFGVAELDSKGFITQLVEKPEHPKTNLAVVGLYFFRNPTLLAECLDEIVRGDKRTKNEYQLTDALQMMIERGERFATFNVDAWYDCGKPETMLSTNEHLLRTKRIADDAPKPRKIEGVLVVDPVYIADDAVITNSIIGPNATIASGARISDSIIRNSIIGSNVLVQSALLEDTIAGNNTIVKGSFSSVNIGDGSEARLS